MIFSITRPMIPMMMMYNSIGADSNELFRLRIRMPKPDMAPVDSAAMPRCPRQMT